MRKEEVIDAILAYHPAIVNEESCDNYKSGFADENCTGVAVALVPTIDVIRRTIEAGCNLLVTHEPLYYQTPDYPKWFAGYDNHVAEEKQKLIEKHHLTIWRDHDHMHADQPDSIFSGVIKALGWETYFCPMNDLPELTYLFRIPTTPAGEIAAHLIKTIGLNGLRIIGNEDAKISKIAIVGHLYPEAFGKTKETEAGYTDYATELIRLMEQEGVQAIIPGEVIEWTILSYIRDAAALGEEKVCFNIGHFNLEEAGMKYFAETITGLTKGSVAVKYLPTGDIGTYMLQTDY